MIIKVKEYMHTRTHVVGKVGTRVDKTQKIRYDIFVSDDDMLRLLDRHLFPTIAEIGRHHFGKDIRYRERWKIGYYIGSEGGFYIPHRDTTGVTCYRDLSLVISLSDASDYVGGELHFPELKEEFKLGRGEGIIFRSDILHGVKPVTGGERIVLITFMFTDAGLGRREGPKQIDAYIPLGITPSAAAPDADYSNSEATWADSDNYYLQKGTTRTLIVVFSGFGTGGGLPPFIFTKFFKDLPHDRLYIRDLKCNWYLNGIRGITGGVEDTAAWIRTLVEWDSYDKIYVVGCSAGGFAAILYGRLLDKVSAIYAFSPQTILSEEKTANDGRFENTCKYIRGIAHARPYLDLRLVKDVSPVPTYIFYGSGNKEDTYQATRMLEPNIRLNPVVTANHTSALKLKYAGKLHAVFEFWA